MERLAGAVKDVFVTFKLWRIDARQVLCAVRARVARVASGILAVGVVVFVAREARRAPGDTRHAGGGAAVGARVA